MALTVEFLKELGIEEELAKKVFSERGKEIEKEKAKLTAAEAEIKEKKEAFEKLSTEFESLKQANASADDYKAKFEALQKDIKDKEEKEKADRAAKEKAEGISNRFNSVLGDKKFSHEAIKADYLKKFGEALENKDFEGKSDSEIFHELTKDDSGAFSGVKVTNLAGASPIDNNSEKTGGNNKPSPNSFF